MLLKDGKEWICYLIRLGDIKLDLLTAIPLQIERKHLSPFAAQVLAQPQCQKCERRGYNSVYSCQRCQRLALRACSKHWNHW